MTSYNISLSDLRSTKQIRELKEFHGEDITQIKYQLSNSNKLISGSMDGTVCIFDLLQADEDEVLLSCNYN
jgi:WD40 repeat protein